MIKIKIPLAEQGIIAFYDEIAKQFGYGDDTVRYDCTKVEVSQERFEAIEKTYNGDRQAFGMHWVIYGPKTNENLVGDEVLVDEGFIKFPVEEEVA